MALPDLPLPSERSFGLFFGAVFAAIGLWLVYKGSLAWAAAFGVAAVAVAVVALAAPRWLALPNRWWFKFGLLLGAIVSPIVLGLLFFVLITPIALVMKLFGRDALERRFDPRRRSYWVEREPPGPTGDSFRNQF